MVTEETYLFTDIVLVMAGVAGVAEVAAVVRIGIEGGVTGACKNLDTRGSEI